MSTIIDDDDEKEEEEEATEGAIEVKVDPVGTEEVISKVSTEVGAFIKETIAKVITES